MLPSPAQTPLSLHPSPGTAPRRPSFHSMHSQLKKIYTTDMLSVICGHWQLLGRDQVPGAGRWAGGCPQQQVHILRRLVTSPALAVPAAHRENTLERRGGSMIPGVLLLLGALGTSLTPGKSGPHRASDKARGRGRAPWLHLVLSSSRRPRLGGGRPAPRETFLGL